ncbi:benzoate 1,2-dioxygenase electron transfer component BenC [Pedobacter gandavensis]|uniref:2Fe-2S iron-sulfur cluster binding domain-containing protein n=1 Tax=Pedobacter gandavensis TaxID=2679963 RepID=A0ABR6EQ81_9SPHI|nr:benzoate 1,2-dioxygenase electron transfer component BenC [Pedobacter gandavensis]MBB2147409.1 2Fe-2S iron-sulfur cluster binding domain-containing protein [Pedobacter gandavensis]
MAKVALNFEDGVTRFIETTGYETIAEAAYRLGVNIPLDCADGACGTCKCLSKSGSFDPGDYIDEALSEEEAENGYGLACQMRPKSDMIVDIFASAAACKVEVHTYETEITGLTFLSSEIVRLKAKITDGSTITFLPGQYANILVPGSTETRSYSFSCLSDTNEMEFIIRLIPNAGLMSNYLRQAKIGEALSITGPVGSFYSRDVKRETLFFAGGTGIAPFIAMLEKLNSEGNPQLIKLFYGATTVENIIDLDRIKTFTNLNVVVYPCVSSGNCDAYPSGYVTQWVNKEELKGEIYDIYICGPNAMVDAVKSSIAAHQINFENFYTEKFVPTGVLTV